MVKNWLFCCFLLLVLDVVLGQSNRSFVIDYPNNQFLLDGEPFRYVSGSLHYFRVPQDYWKDRMTKFRAAGLNAIQTYIEWSSHEPEPGQYDFEGNLDLLKFITQAQEEGLLVILRPGPYIDAERDMGGLPYWLLREKPNIALRSSDSDFEYYVQQWYSIVLPMVRPYLYANGGPIIMAQVENEYGSYGCDWSYKNFLRDIMRQYLGDEVLLFTTDGAEDNYLTCGKVPLVYATVDFGIALPTQRFAVMRNHEPHGPLVNSEFYPGWMDHWEYRHSVVPAFAVNHVLDKILSLNASVNIYMFHGGTSFGFKAGANDNPFKINPTSYDYDAPLTEAGDPTHKYYILRNTIKKYLPLPDIRRPEPSAKGNYGSVQMMLAGNIFSALSELSTALTSQWPLTFEALSQSGGFVLYETTVTQLASDPALLSVPGLADRGYIFIDGNYVGLLSRGEAIFDLGIHISQGQVLRIFVENQGRVCYGPHINDFKGITQNVTLGGKTLSGWTMYSIALNDTTQLRSMVDKHGNSISTKSVPLDNGAFGIYYGEFVLDGSGNDTLLDTFLRLDGWNKGVAFLNGVNLGRYWPVVGPQVTLYVPAPYLVPPPATNQLIVFEQEGAPCQQQSTCYITLVDTPELNGPTPYSWGILPIEKKL